MSKDLCIAERLQNLRSLREKLCQKEKNWQEAFNARDWIVTQISNLRSLATSKESTKSDIIDRIDDILCVLDPDKGDSNDK